MYSLDIIEIFFEHKLIVELNFDPPQGTDFLILLKNLKINFDKILIIKQINEMINNEILTFGL